MKFKSGVLAQASGSVGGYVYSHNRGGMYLRNRSTPTNPGTSAQVQVRGTFGTLASQWQTLSAAQRAAWTLYAANVPITDALGDPLTLTGLQMFIRCNAARVRLGLSAVADGPTVYALANIGPVTASVTAATGVISVTFTETDPWVDEDDAALGVYISQDKAVTINYFKGPYRVAGKIDGDSVTAPTSPDTSLSSPFTHVNTNNCFFRFIVCRADGRISPVTFVGPVGVV